MSALYLRGDLYKLALCLCSQVKGVFSYSLPTSPVPLGQGPLTVPSFSWAGYTKDQSLFSELALDAKIAFSICTKSKGPWLPALERNSLYGLLLAFQGQAMGKGWAEVCERSEQLPIIKLSLIAAYLWFPLTAPSQGVRPK